jgi:hypothetical protein
VPADRLVVLVVDRPSRDVLRGEVCAVGLNHRLAVVPLLATDPGFVVESPEARSLGPNPKRPHGTVRRGGPIQAGCPSCAGCQIRSRLKGQRSGSYCTLTRPPPARPGSPDRVAITQRAVESAEARRGVNGLPSNRTMKPCFVPPTASLLESSPGKPTT